MRFPACLAAAAAALVLAGPAIAKPNRAPALSAPARQALAPVLVDARRTQDRPRDVWRHPAETLAFCRIEPGMTVVDYMPGGGWWTRILVPYLGENGRYIALNPDVRAAPDELKQYMGNIAVSFPPKVTEWTGASASRFGAYNSDGLPEALSGTLDRVMVMRQIHNIQRFGMLYRELGTVRRLLKPGGLLCLEEHRAKPGASAAYADGSMGYMREKDVIALVEAHGFELVGKSEVNANPKDSADHPAGVWVLPPTLREGEKDRARYTAIGESDRMTLLFRKRP